MNVINGHAYDPRKIIAIDYTNHRGERATRAIVPHYLWWGVTSYHPEEQWLLHALDVDKGAFRDFAFNNVHGLAERSGILATTHIVEGEHVGEVKAIPATS